MNYYKMICEKEPEKLAIKRRFREKKGNVKRKKGTTILKKRLSFLVLAGE